MNDNEHRPHLPRIDCDECGGVADAVHFLPWIAGCERVVFTCPEHDAGGYWFDLARLFGDGMAAHVVESKRGGWRALAMLFERIQPFADREDERFSAALRAKAIETGHLAPDAPADAGFAVPASVFLSVDPDAA